MEAIFPIALGDRSRVRLRARKDIYYSATFSKHHTRCLLTLFFIRKFGAKHHDIENKAANQSTLSIAHHVKTIEAARKRVKDAIFDVVDAILDAENHLDETAFQDALGVEIGMSKGTISKWLSIGKSPFISENRRVLPCTFTT